MLVRDCRLGWHVLTPALIQRLCTNFQTRLLPKDHKMSLPPKSAAPNGTHGQAAPQTQMQIRVLNQYIKDLSFENPNIGKQMLVQGENPNLQVEVNVNAQRVGETVFESAIKLKADCTAKSGVLYDLEIEYGALFDLPGLPEPALEQFLLVNCPALIFPFLRRIVADVSREGGFPPLLLDPIDFAMLYMRRREQNLADAGNDGTAKV
jgi:preprotein translocase subunit SecB